MGKKKGHVGSAGRLRMEFDLKQLAVFVEVVEQESFSGAARALNMAQASVSERISTLERALGTQLLDRLGRKALPTETGKVLLGKARALLELRTETLNELKEVLDLSHGHVVLGASSTPGEYILPELLRRFKEAYPVISVRLIVGGSEAITREVERGALEFGVVGFREKSDTLKYSAFSKDQIVVAVSSSHPLARGAGPVAPADLLTQPMVLREPGSGTRAVAMQHLAAALKGANPLPDLVTELGSTTAVKEGVKVGLGYTLISRRAITSEVRAKTLKEVDVEGLNIERRFYLVHDRRRARSPATRALMGFLLDQEKSTNV